MRTAVHAGVNLICMCINGAGPRERQRERGFMPSDVTGLITHTLTSSTGTGQIFFFFLLLLILFRSFFLFLFQVDEGGERGERGGPKRFQ